MKIHEYQAAALFAAYGVRVPEGQMAKTAAEAEAAARWAVPASSRRRCTPAGAARPAA